MIQADSTHLTKSLGVDGQLHVQVEGDVRDVVTMFIAEDNPIFLQNNVLKTEYLKIKMSQTLKPMVLRVKTRKDEWPNAFFFQKESAYTASYKISPK